MYHRQQQQQQQQRQGASPSVAPSKNGFRSHTENKHGSYGDTNTESATEILCDSIDRILARHGWPNAIVDQGAIDVCDPSNHSLEQAAGNNLLLQIGLLGGSLHLSKRWKAWALCLALANGIHQAVQRHTGVGAGALLRWVVFSVALFWVAPRLALMIGVVLATGTAALWLFHRYRYRNMQEHTRLVRLVFPITNVGPTDPRKTPTAAQALGPGFEYTLESVDRAPFSQRDWEDQDGLRADDGEEDDQAQSVAGTDGVAVAWVGTRVDAARYLARQHSAVMRCLHWLQALLGLNSYLTPFCLFAMLVYATSLSDHWSGYTRPYEGVYRVWKALLHDMQQVLG